MFTNLLRTLVNRRMGGTTPTTPGTAMPRLSSEMMAAESPKMRMTGIGPEPKMIHAPKGPKVVK